MADKVIHSGGGGAMSVFWGLFLFFIVFPVVVIVGCFACTGSVLNEISKQPAGENSTANSSSAEPSQPVPSASVKAAGLLQEYLDNEIAADRRYKGRWVEVSGTIDNIGKDVLGTRYITLKGDEEYGIFSIQCYFGNEYDQVLSQLSPGDSVARIVGRCDGKFGNVLLKECFVKPEEKAPATQQVESQKPKYVRDKSTGMLYPEGHAPQDESADEIQEQPPAINRAASQEFMEELLSEEDDAPEEQSAPKLRTWSSADGKFTVEADFVSMGAGQVKLRKVDGSIATVPMSKLSNDDQKFIRQHGARRPGF